MINALHFDVYRDNPNIYRHDHIPDAIHPYFFNRPYALDIAYEISYLIKYPIFIAIPVHVTINKKMKAYYLDKPVMENTADD